MEEHQVFEASNPGLEERPRDDLESGANELARRDECDVHVGSESYVRKHNGHLTTVLIEG